jgi:uncharacterized protein
MSARLAEIWIFPIKALDGVQVPAVELTNGGGLAGDRRFALLDLDGRFINGKREPRIHAIRASYDADQRHVRLLNGLPTATDTTPSPWLDLAGDGPALCAWFSRALRRPVTLARNDQGGFPDDGNASGPTLVSRASLATVATWFGDMDPGQANRRFRTNLIIDAEGPFWEDRLYGPAGTTVRFCVGEVLLEGTNPCQRCVVPTRDPETGIALAGFQKGFVMNRQRSLPAFAERARFDHYYRFAVNTRPAPGQTGKRLRVGDPVRPM